MTPSLLQQCEQLLGCKISGVQAIHGGDINEARLLETTQGPVFLKFNDGLQAKDLLAAEAQSRRRIAEADCIATPTILGLGQQGDTALLLLSFIRTARPGVPAWEQFGRALAALHRITQPTFGLDHDNFIGSLPQANGACVSWAAFYRQRRLAPQLAMAMERGLLDWQDAAQFERLYGRLDELCPVEPPALIHGDLWSGNSLIDEQQQAVLIDPCVSYAHREMDLAMSRLFGGFAPSFYAAYQETYPLAPGFEDRLELYQLYYLLAHVNLFGWSYVGAVKRVLGRYV
ncbi:MAG: fructosamine kinase family protein [Bacteroidota bacterium]